MSFQLVTYNVLAQAYIKPDRYPDCADEALEAGFRQRLLTQRIVSFEADLLCLQEVEPSAYQALQAALPEHAGAYEQKRDKPDGSAVFWRRSLFSLERQAAVHYRAIEPGYDHVGLAVWLRHGARALAVASTHLRWQGREVPPERHLGRLQLQELLAVLRQGPCPTWVVCGDLNAAHDGPVLSEAARAGLTPSAANLRPWDTALINGRRRKLDYVLADHGRLRPSARALPPLSRHRPIPSGTEPSDHLPLRVDLDWC